MSNKENPRQNPQAEEEEQQRQPSQQQQENPQEERVRRCERQHQSVRFREQGAIADFTRYNDVRNDFRLLGGADWSF